VDGKIISINVSKKTGAFVVRCTLLLMCRLSALNNKTSLIIINYVCHHLQLNDRAVRHTTLHSLRESHPSHRPIKISNLVQRKAYETAVISLARRAGHEVLTSEHRRLSARTVKG